MSEPLNPVDIETHILDTINRLAKSVRYFSDAEAAKYAAERALVDAFAMEWALHEGTQFAKRYHADRATMPQRKARDDAIVLFNKVKNEAENLRGELFAFQNLNNSVSAMYGAARY